MLMVASVRSDEMMLTGLRGGGRPASEQPHVTPLLSKLNTRRKQWDTPRFKEDQTLSQRRVMEQPMYFFYFFGFQNPQGPITGCTAALLPWDTQIRM